MSTRARRHRVGIFCPGTGAGGPWRSVHSVLRRIDLDEFEVVVFCDLESQYEPRVGVRVASLGAASPPSAPKAHAASARSRWRLLPRAVRISVGFARNAVRLARLIRPWDLDLFHTHWTGCEEAPVAARLAGVPHVVGHFQVDPTYDLNGERSGPAFRLLERLSNGCLDVGIAISRSTRALWVERTRIPARRVRTIYNAIDADQFRRRRSQAEARRALGVPADGRVYVGGIGRLEEAKGFTYLIQAVAALAPRWPNLGLLIAGVGPLRDDLTAEANRLGVGDRVHLLGFRTDVQEVLDALDVFAMPSVCEAFGYALAEAMATELPAVGSAVGGIPELIVHGRTGFVVPPRDPHALAQSLDALLGSADLARQYGRAGRERIANYFRESDMVDSTIDVYRELLRSGQPAYRRWSLNPALGAR